MISGHGPDAHAQAAGSSLFVPSPLVTAEGAHKGAHAHSGSASTANNAANSFSTASLTTSGCSSRSGSPAPPFPAGPVTIPPLVLTGSGLGSAHNSPLSSFRTPPVEDHGLNSTMARMFTNGGSRGNSLTNSPVWSPNSSPLMDDGRSIRLIGSGGDAVAHRIEQERRRARGSIYAQRSRDNSKAQAIRLRLQSEVQLLQASNAQLDASLAQYASVFPSSALAGAPQPHVGAGAPQPHVGAGAPQPHVGAAVPTSASMALSEQPPPPPGSGC